jgi:hypothetical protein
MEGLVRTYYISPVDREITMAFWSSGDLVSWAIHRVLRPSAASSTILAAAAC